MTPEKVTRRSGLLGAFALACALFANGARAEGNWSTWQTFDSEQVSVSFLKVANDTWTWKFRNEGSVAITYMAFDYTDKDGTHSDVIPSPIEPHAAFGGWAAYTASSNPSIRIKEIKRR